MSTILMVIVGLLITVTGIYIYNSNLTESTEKDEEENKKKGLNIHTKPNIKTNGYYVNRLEKLDPYGNNVKLTTILIFTNLGYVAFVDMEGHPKFTNEEIREVINTVDNEIDNEVDINDNLATYNKHNDNDSLIITFFNPEKKENHDILNPQLYTRFKGTIINNGLILNYMHTYFSFELKGIQETTDVKNMKFEFVKVDFV